jgi:DNA polymerase-3 subunit gamma/tau
VESATSTAPRADSGTSAALRTPPVAPPRTAPPVEIPAPDRGAAPAMRALPVDPAQWPSFVAALKLTGVAGQLAAQTELVRCTGRELTLGLPESQRHLTDKSYVDKLTAAIADATGARPRIVFEFASSADSSLAAQERRERAEQKAKTEAAFRDEPFVREALARFSATIKPDSIKPVS